eukprot:jgi/Bigna1/82661/fgenesh1_pg.95_\
MQNLTFMYLRANAGRLTALQYIEKKLAAKDGQPLPGFSNYLTRRTLADDGFLSVPPDHGPYVYAGQSDDPEQDIPAFTKDSWLYKHLVNQDFNPIQRLGDNSLVRLQSDLAMAVVAGTNSAKHPHQRRKPEDDAKKDAAEGEGEGGGGVGEEGGGEEDGFYDHGDGGDDAAEDPRRTRDRSKSREYLRSKDTYAQENGKLGAEARDNDENESSSRLHQYTDAASYSDAAFSAAAAAAENADDVSEGVQLLEQSRKRDGSTTANNNEDNAIDDDAAADDDNGWSQEKALLDKMDPRRQKRKRRRKKGVGGGAERLWSADSERQAKIDWKNLPRDEEGHVIIPGPSLHEDIRKPRRSQEKRAKVEDSYDKHSERFRLSVLKHELAAAKGERVETLSLDSRADNDEEEERKSHEHNRVGDFALFPNHSKQGSASSITLKNPADMQEQIEAILRHSHNVIQNSLSTMRGLICESAGRVQKLEQKLCRWESNMDRISRYGAMSNEIQKLSNQILCAQVFSLQREKRKLQHQLDNKIGADKKRRRTYEDGAGITLLPHNRDYNDDENDDEGGSYVEGEEVEANIDGHWKSAKISKIQPRRTCVEIEGIPGRFWDQRLRRVNVKSPPGNFLRITQNHTISDLTMGESIHSRARDNGMRQATARASSKGERRRRILDKIREYKMQIEGQAAGAYTSKDMAQVITSYVKIRDVKGCMEGLELMENRSLNISYGIIESVLHLVARKGDWKAAVAIVELLERLNMTMVAAPVGEQKATNSSVTSIFTNATVIRKLLHKAWYQNLVNERVDPADRRQDSESEERLLGSSILSEIMWRNISQLCLDKIRKPFQHKKDNDDLRATANETRAVMLAGSLPRTNSSLFTSTLHAHENSSRSTRNESATGQPEGQYPSRQYLTAARACWRRGAWISALSILKEAFPHEVAMLRDGVPTGRWVPCRIIKTDEKAEVIGDGGGGAGTTLKITGNHSSSNLNSTEPTIEGGCTVSLITGRTGPARFCYIRPKFWNVSKEEVPRALFHLRPSFLASKTLSLGRRGMRSKQRHDASSQANSSSKRNLSTRSVFGKDVRMCSQKRSPLLQNQQSSTNNSYFNITSLGTGGGNSVLPSNTQITASNPHEVMIEQYKSNMSDLMLQLEAQLDNLNQKVDELRSPTGSNQGCSNNISNPQSMPPGEHLGMMNESLPRMGEDVDDCGPITVE